MTTAHIEPAPVGKVYEGVANILKHLSVEKGGVLPGNMGGKAYITAQDAAAEVKRQFVENNLIFLPHESLTKHEVVIFKDRLNIATVIEGEYTIVSTEDGSSVTVSGVGDGLATGTAVSSNIASTNALKNALLRTFLITEQSVEDAAKNGVPDTAPAQSSNEAQRKVAQAKQATAPAAPAAAGGELAQLNAKIRDYIGSDNARRDDVNARIEAAKAANGNNATEARKTVIKDLGI